MALFRARVEIGVSRLGRCSFTTITYEADGERTLDAACVRADWQALWRSLRRKGMTWSWLKVTEKTKRGTPHHHIVLGTLEPGQEVRCHGRTISRGKETSRYIRRIDSCTCVSHIFAREWWRITGDSFMCFATPVSDAAGAASYMSKYMQKTFESREAREIRRFSMSRDWPGGGRIRLAQTVAGGWSHIRRWNAPKFPTTQDLNPNEHDLLLRVGEDLTMELSLRNLKRKARSEYRRFIDDHRT